MTEEKDDKKFDWKDFLFVLLWIASLLTIISIMLYLTYPTTDQSVQMRANIQTVEGTVKTVYFKTGLIKQTEITFDDNRNFKFDNVSPRPLPIGMFVKIKFNGMNEIVDVE